MADQAFNEGKEAPNALEFHVREVGQIYATSVVTAIGAGQNFEMLCSCMAGRHRALLCSHIIAVLCEDEDLVRSGCVHFAKMRERAEASILLDPDNGYWKYFSKELPIVLKKHNIQE